MAVDTFDQLYTKKAVKGHKIHKNSEKMSPKDEYAKVVLDTQGVTISLKKFELMAQDPESWTIRGIHNSIMKQVMDDSKHCKECSCVSDSVGKGRAICKTVLSCY